MRCELARKAKSERRYRCTEDDRRVDRKLVEWFILRHPESCRHKLQPMHTLTVPIVPGLAEYGREEEERAKVRLWQERGGAPLQLRDFVGHGKASAKGRFALARVRTPKATVTTPDAWLARAWRSGELSERSEPKHSNCCRGRLTREENGGAWTSASAPGIFQARSAPRSISAATSFRS